MMKDISIGRYVNGNSVLHKLDPRVKVLLFILYMVTIFLANRPVAMLATFAVVLFLALLSRISFIEILKSIRPIIFIMAFIFVINVFTIRSGEELWSWGFLKITTGGLEQAVMLACRLLLLIMATSILLSLTTTPLKFADALESLGKPLKLIKVPVNEMAMTISIALRFIPTLVEETDKIMKAQSSRGAEYDTGNLFQRVKGYVTVLVPLFVSAFKRAEELATAMEARCYRGGVGKTKLHPLKMKGSDYLWGSILTVTAILPLVVDFFWKLK
ncbi:MAG: energy-coupling factor transporter transmembrane protein EcfT [Clostridiales bacterium]|nr:energy-coupling factor transporter transmembrane protein EcfT [Candidatus Scatonaster coprocaballi]